MKAFSHRGNALWLLSLQEGKSPVHQSALSLLTDSRRESVLGSNVFYHIFRYVITVPQTIGLKKTSFIFFSSEGCKSKIYAFTIFFKIFTKTLKFFYGVCCFIIILWFCMWMCYPLLRCRFLKVKIQVYTEIYVKYWEIFLTWDILFYLFKWNYCPKSQFLSMSQEKRRHLFK